MLSIAIDGPVGAGKSSIADEVCRRLGILHLDTGAMYRAVGLAALNEGVDPGDEAAVCRLCREDGARVDVRYQNGKQVTLLNGKDVSDEIRTLTAGGAASAWAYGSTASATLPNQEPFVSLMNGLYAGCSLTVQGGKVKAVTLRPQSGNGAGNATGLSAGLLQQLDVTVGIVTRQSRTEGKATEDGAGLTIPAKMAKFTVQIGDKPVPDRGNTKGFLSLDGTRVTLNPQAKEGASAKIGVSNADGTWRTLTFTKIDQRRITVAYHSQDTMEK